MMIEASAAIKAERRKREEAEARRRIREIVWVKRGVYINLSDMPRKKVTGLSGRRVRTANWTRALDAAFLRILKHEYLQGNFIGGLFTKGAWIRIVGDFNSKTKLNLNKGHLQNRLKVLKGMFKLYHNLATMSGCQWDPDRNVPTVVDPSNLERIVAANPQYAKFRDKPFPAYAILKLFYGDTSNEEEVDADALDVSDNEDDSSSSLKLSEKNASTEKERDKPAPGASNKDDDGASASDDISSSSLSGRTFVISKALEELLELGRRQQEIAKELLNHEVSDRSKPYSVEQCMSKLRTVRNISSEAILAACEAFRDKHERCIFMHLKGSVLHAWLERKLVVHSIYQQPIQPLQQLRSDNPLAAPCPPPEEIDFS
ncbi:uncharacterized protein [Typha latifolia]|uniref:uncharacterized protein isoform X2 n=2 Tax=Typha latifolia TaxID=4733 RepID=UPI003C2C745E